MPSEPLPSFLPHLCQRFHSLICSCLDSDLVKTAVFYAESYYSIDQHNHDARHLYATALLRAQQTYSALHLVNGALDEQCTGCLEIKARCCAVLGRYRQAREALVGTALDTNYVSTASTSNRVSRVFPDEAALRCRAGNMALKGNQPDKAIRSFHDALTLNPYVWEALEGLCATGSIPEIDELFPPRPPPVKRAPPVEENWAKTLPVASGAGFFTPDAGGAGGGGGTLFHQWKPDVSQPQPFRMAPLPRDSLVASDASTFIPDNSFQVHRVSRSQPTNIGPIQTHVSRPLSSADEAGPVTKRLRSTTRQPEPIKPKSSKSSLDDPLKKARARPALSFANIFSSSSRSQSTTSSRTNTGLGKSNSQTNVSHIPTRRSNRLLSGTATKQLQSSKHPPARDRRRQPTHARNKSTESDRDEGSIPSGEVADSTSPPSPAALSPRSEVSPSPSNWTSAQEQQSQEDYEIELADQYLYDLVRKFASVARRLALYDCKRCLKDLEQLPPVHQKSASVLIMVGKVHYELQDYASAERAFKAARAVEPYRLWDMEAYSTLLWHLQRNIELSYLAQELLNINPKSAQAWIAIGNLFSLQKDRAQALTCFRRASQLDPSCAYAFTLSGHETIDEDLDKAINFFQSALRVDARHFNAWYGLGTCYLRMSKIRLAEYHYKKAVEIHPNNAVLLGCLGMTSERRGDRNTALDFFNKAVECSPDNALVRYRRAKIMIAMRKYQAALDDLEHLRRTTPEEANVIFQLAKVYRLIGDEINSAKSLAAARDIAPKSLAKMKRLLETVKDESDDKMDEG